MSRRGFVAMSIGSLASLMLASCADGESGDGPLAVPADKGRDLEQLRLLATRGTPTTYSGDALFHIGMPVGGVTAGQLYLGGDGRLWWWDIDNPATPPTGDLDFGGGHYAAPVSYIDAATYRPRFRQGFALRTTTSDGVRTRSLDANGFPATGIAFTGQYPLGKVTYAAADSPLEITLEAFSPFVPLSAADSSLPATVLVYTLRNASGAPVRAELAGFSDAPICLDSRHQQPLRLRAAEFLAGDGKAIEFSAADAPVHTDPRPDILFEDFEAATYAGWTVTGTAFGAGPVTEAELPEYMKRFGPLHVHGTRFVTSHDFRGSGGDLGRADAATGTLTSAPFVVERRYVSVWVGGGGIPNRACVNVRVDGQIVGSVTGANTELMAPRTIDVHAYEGRTATIEIVDTATAGWGHINCDWIVFTDLPPSAMPFDELPDNGTFALAAFDPRAVAVPSLERFDSLDDVFDAAAGPLDVDASLRTISGAVRVALDLAPGASTTVTFAIGWSFPLPRRELFAGLIGAEEFLHHYSTRFETARAALGHLAQQRERLLSATRAWVNTWYNDSTLPHWFLERTFAPVSTAATTTCYRFDNGRFYGFEGVYCCIGTCQHVWNYAQSIARIFPELERDTRERVDLGIAYHSDTGALDHRAEGDRRVAADGQCGTILRVYREHQMSADSSFLNRVWPRVKKAIQYMIGQDRDNDGILEGEQLNTLDQAWWGEIPWISGMYVAALRAGEAMANEMFDPIFASRCRTLATRGTKYLTEQLWNDTYGYFIQNVDPQHPSTNSNRGCYVDQLFGQTFASQLGLPRVFPADKSKVALENLYKYNFLPDPIAYRAQSPIGDGGRIYAKNQEAGLLSCTWPFGGGGEAPGGGWPVAVAYFNEVWTGLEYQAAAGMFAEGLTDQAMAVTRAVYDRYQAAKRNPYNEIECSDHYSRAMMGHAVFLAACGYEYHGPKGHLGFAPKVDPENFACAFTGAAGWGRYAQERTASTQTCRIEVRYGDVRLRSLAFETPTAASSVTVTLDGANLSATKTSRGNRTEIALRNAVTVAAGHTLTVVLQFA
ncbi:non-lysosomal glucosylceramidase [Pendulispora rubella]|uniref:Non-lysosomal glucosylceramidase n=1 Tax=Pendulispora rubella TaxID=2741070 RepID=A0ABZ2LFR6_9BACT